MSKYVRILSVLPALVVMLGIFSLSSQTAVESKGLSQSFTVEIIEVVEDGLNLNLTESERSDWLNHLGHMIRKAAHMTEYAILGISVAFSFFVYGRLQWVLVRNSEAVCVFYAITDEFHQLFVSGRGPRVSDVFIDGCGALIGCLIFAMVKGKLRCGGKRV